MDFRQIIKMGLEEYYEQLLNSLDSLTPDERRFQPNPASHHVDFTVWHMARVEDSWIQRFARNSEQVWTRDQWQRKFQMPSKDSGFGYSKEQVASLPVFQIEEMLEYYESVRTETFDFMNGLTNEGLDQCPQPTERPGYTIGKMFSHIIVEESQHTGQVSYIRGIIRGINQ